MRRIIECEIKSKPREEDFLNLRRLEYPDLRKNALGPECGKRQKTLSWSQ